MTQEEELNFEEYFGPLTYVTKSGRVTSIEMAQQTKLYALTEDILEKLVTQLAAPSRAAETTSGSFTTCSYTYDGRKSADVVEAFLSAVNIFKRRERIPDQAALEELPLLLKDEAGIWWQGVKGEIDTWEKFQMRLRDTFAPKKEAYLIFHEITQIKQGRDISTEDFIRHKRFLFSQLSNPALTETLQLDILYGILSLEIRDKIPRASVKTFDELIKAARAAEHVMTEMVSETAAEMNQPVSKPGGQKKRCKFCKNLGHTIETCRKKQFAEDKKQANESRSQNTAVAITQAPSPSTPKFSCYGCGAPGVVRSNCSTCHKSKERSTSDIGVYAIDTPTDSRDRPMIYFEIGDIVTSAFIDSGAKTSIASYALYMKLKNKGYRFKEVDVGVTLADGIKRKQNVLVTKVPVKFHSKTVLTTFLVFPEARNNHSLLGVGFLQDSHMVLNLPQNTFYFLEDPEKEIELYEEGFITFNENICLAPVTATESMSSVSAQSNAA